MNPNKVKRENVVSLTDLPNIGPAMARDLMLLGIEKPDQLSGRSAYDMYYELCEITGRQQDPCVIDVFLSITDFMNGQKPKVWWKYTQQRKDFLKQYKKE
jgi:hypothetical protein